MDDKKYGEDIVKLNLYKYGLDDLEGKNVLTLVDSEMDRLLTALGNDEISLNIPLACTAENVKTMLSYSECRRCGKCCKPNPQNPDSPGVEVFEEELKSMTEYLHLPYEDIKKKTATGSVTPYAYQIIKLGFTRWLPLPCPFYSEQQNGCLAYPARAVVCQIYPVIFTGDDSYISVRVTCDYGKDIVKKAYTRLREANPDLEILL
jgi:Fe-S-cluster containining protein